MIICNHEEARFEGSIIGVIQDSVNILIGLRETLRKEVTDEFADAVIALIGRTAFAEDEESTERLCEEMLACLIAGRKKGPSC